MITTLIIVIIVNSKKNSWYKGVILYHMDVYTEVDNFLKGETFSYSVV